MGGTGGGTLSPPRHSAVRIPSLCACCRPTASVLLPHRVQAAAEAGLRTGTSPNAARGRNPRGKLGLGTLARQANSVGLPRQQLRGTAHGCSRGSAGASPSQGKPGLVRRVRALHPPGGAQGAGEQAVGVGGVGEALGFKVPAELAAEGHGDGADVRDGGAAVAHLGREVGVAAGLHAVEEVAVLPRRAGEEVGLVRADGRGEDGGVAGLEGLPPPAVADPAVGALEAERGAAALDEQLDAVGVAAAEVVLVEGVVEAADVAGAGALDLDGAAALGVVGPLDGVELVAAPVGEDARPRQSARMPAPVSLT